MSTPIQQVTFFIPADIQLGLDAGKLVRYGGVVRNQLGHIVTHLKEMPTEDQERAAAQRAAALLRDPRIVSAVVVGTVAAAGIGLVASSRGRQARRFAKNLNASLIAYLAAARDGTLDETAISRLIADLDAAEAYADNGRVAVASTLVDLVVDYTARLAEANSMDANELPPVDPNPQGANVLDLRQHLEVQRKIFRKAA